MTWPSDSLGTSTFLALHKLFLDAQIALGLKLVQWSLDLIEE